MNLFLITILNILFIFLAYIILNNKINKNSALSQSEKYTKEVERLIIDLNNALDDALNISEERISELKKLIKKAEKTIRKTSNNIILDREEKNNEPEIKEETPEISKEENLIERTKHLVSMGYSTDEIAKILDIKKAEVEFLKSLNMNKR